MEQTPQALVGYALRRASQHGGALEDASRSPFIVTVGQVYDGPFDLLLDLIRKQNLDIHDIPIARITAQFLDYTRQLKGTDMDAAGEFVYTASLLIHIKSKALLPRDPSIVSSDGASEDPRRELVDRLLEHERFKAAAEMLRQKGELEEATWTYPSLRNDAAPHRSRESREANEADTVDLVRMLQNALDRLKERPVMQVEQEAVTVGLMKDYLSRKLSAEDNPVWMEGLLPPSAPAGMIVPMFLALLDLVRLQAVLVRQSDPTGDILVKKAPAFEVLGKAVEDSADNWR